MTISMIIRLKKLLLLLLLCALLVLLAGTANAAAVILDDESIDRYYQHLDMTLPSEDSFVEGELNAKLPLIVIDTFGQIVPGEPIEAPVDEGVEYTLNVDGERTITTNVKIYDTEGEYNNVSDTAAIDMSAEVRLRGNSSRYFDKSSYKINFTNDLGLEEAVNVMGMGGHDEWALYGPFLDKTLLRNYVFINLYGEIDPMTPEMRYCELILNGEYQGLYIMMETIAVDEDRVDLTPSSTRSDVTSYIVKIDRIGDIADIDSFAKYTLNLENSTAMSIAYPGVNNLTPEFTEYITDDFNQVEKALYSLDFNDISLGYESRIDVQSFVDFYIFNEFLAINDMGNRSIYLHKDLGGKVSMGPLWDMNNAADLYLREVAGSDGQGLLYHDRVYYTMLMKDPAFVEQVIETYYNMRDGGILDEDKILTMIDEVALFLEPEIERNYEVWGYSFDPLNMDSQTSLSPDERNPANYEEAIDDLKDFIVARGEFLDNNIEALRQYCSYNKVKQFYK